MSDGDRKDSANLLSEKESNQLKRGKRKSVADEFPQAIARIAVAQVCESVGFQSFQQSALDRLADVGVRYIREVGKIACSSANSATRSQCNVFDVIQGLEDLGFTQGFPGASDVSHSLSQSGVVRDMIQYVGQAEEIPFAYSIPSFPIVKKRKLDPSFAQAGETPPEEHIPSWLPKFPDPKAYIASSPEKAKASDTKQVSKIEQPNGCRNVQVPLLNLQQKVLCNGSTAEAVAAEGDTLKAQRVAESNPFLAPPLEFGKKEVSLPVVPAKLLEEEVGYHRSFRVTENHLVNLEVSLQPNETERSGPSESEDTRKVPANGRPSIYFKLGNAKKSSSMATVNRNEGIEKFSLWFGDDQDGRDVVNMETDQILLENTENPPTASPL